MKKALSLVVILTIGTGWILYSSRGAEESRTTYRYVEVEKGSLESVVSSTGNLGAVTMVQVGTQVSGIVDKIYVDFNDVVKKGQIVAKIDTTLLVTAIRDANANLQRSAAQLGYAESEFDRIDGLFQKQFATEVELNKAKYDLETAKSSYLSAELNLERAERNLSYATIYSPIDGVVIERSVDVGQTVAASLSAPQLFLVANSLTQLQILASVDESDIGSIHEGQTARFTVQAHDEAVFEGVVRQVRLQSAVQENVVTYTVVVDVDNSDGRLLPGMTATVDFLIESVSDVFKIPNAGLRFRPTEDMMAMVRERLAQNRPADSSRAAQARAGSDEPALAERGRQRGAGAGAGNAGGDQRARGNRGDGVGRGAGGRDGNTRGANGAQLWYFNDTGELTVARVRTGITDGAMTEIIGRNLAEGLQIIAGVSQSAESSAFSNPFQNQPQQGGRRGLGGF